MTYTITLTGTPLSTTFSGTLEQLHQAILAGITGTISTSNIIVGKVGGTMPPGNIGPWLNGDTWYVYDSGNYVPAKIAIGDGVNNATVTGAPTAARTITIQDKDGTLALLSDVYTPRATAYPALAATTTIDWAVSNSFALPLNQSVTLAMANSVSGQEIFIAAYNPGAFTVSWPSDVHWEGGVVPASPSSGKTNVYVLRNIGGHIYGEAMLNY